MSDRGDSTFLHLRKTASSSFDLNAIINGPSGVLIIYSSRTSDGPVEMGSSQVLLNGIKKVEPSHWQPLPHPARLGVGLVYITKDSKSGPLKYFGDERNLLIETLTTDCDPASPDFGKPASKADGGVLFKFDPNPPGTDKLIALPLLALDFFIRGALADIKTALEQEGLEAAQELNANMTPVMFKTFFKQYRANEAKRCRGKGREKVVCPAIIEYEHCENCERSRVRRSP